MIPASVHAPSWYAATANPAPDRPQLTGEIAVDLLIVGGGFTGLSTAIEAARRGFKVALVEAERIGWGASGRNGGQLVTGFNKDIATIARLIGRDDGRRLWDMAEEAKAILRQRVVDYAIDCDLRWGYLHAALKQRHMADLRANLSELEELGYGDSRLIAKDELGTIVDAPGYIGGLLDRGGGQLHPLNYALGLAAGAESEGVAIYERTPVTGIATGDPVVATTPRGRIRARFTVLACNAHLEPIADVARKPRSRIMPVGTYMIATRPLEEELARAVLPGNVAVGDLNFVLNYFRLSHDRRMLFGGGVSYSGLDPVGLKERLTRTMADTLPRLKGVDADYCWGGYVAITINRLPDLGRVAPNVYYAQGYSGHGVLLTGIAGRVLAEAIAGQAGRFDVWSRLPHRPFPGGRLLRTPALVMAMTWYRLRDWL